MAVMRLFTALFALVVGSAAFGQVATVPPGGRITINPGVSEMRVDYVGSNKVFYAPHNTGLVSVYNGILFNVVSILSSPSDKIGAELDLDSSYAPNTIYDLFVYSDDGVTGKPCAIAWSDSRFGLSQRSTQIDMWGGAVVNSSAATCKVSGSATVALPQHQGTHVGYFFTSDAAGYVDFKFGNAGLGGGSARVSISNAYNKVRGVFVVQDTAVAIQPINAGWEPFNIRCTGCTGGQTNIIKFLSDGGAVDASLSMGVYPSSGANLYAGVALNGVTSAWSKCAAGPGGPAGATSIFHSVVSLCGGYPPIGLNYLQAMELGSLGGTSGTLYSNQIPQLGALIARFDW